MFAIFATVLILTVTHVVPTLAAETLPLVVVTATRTARSVDQNLAAVTVLDQEDITQGNAVTIPELLRNVSGVDFNSSGAFGKTANMSLRGTNANHVLFLVEGIPLSSATVGAPAWEYLPLAHSQRLEVVNGPRSSLYGSAAIGGIVQMFMPRGTSPAHVEFATTVGSFATHATQINVAGATDDTHYYLGVAHLTTAGIDAGNPFSSKEPDRDGYRNSSYALHLGQRFGQNTIDGYVLRAAGHSAFDGAPDEDFLQQIAGLNLLLSPANFWQTKFTLGAAHDKRDSEPAVFAYRLHTSRMHYAWQNDLTLARDHLLTIGVDRQDEHVAANTAFTINTRNNTGVFLQHQATIGNHDLIAGLRYDDNETFGGHTTGNLAHGIALTPQLRLTAAWGTAFKAPTFNDLYWPFDGFYSGNPNLRPEIARAYELGLTGSAALGNWELRTFRTDIDDLITYTYNPATNLGTMANLNRARIDGWELRAATRFMNWDLTAALDVLDPRDRATAKILPRRARHTMRCHLSRQFGPLRANLTVLNQGGRYDNVDNTIHLPGYSVMDLSLNYAVTSAWTLTGMVNNILDTDYQTVAGYNSPTRATMLMIRYAPAPR